MNIAIAMSGGVDSSVAAKILCDQGHEVVGLFLKLWSDPSSPELLGTSPNCRIKENRCCNYEALEDARKVANQLKIPFYVINARDQFKAEVVDYFLDEYKNLRTPNPCIVCNDKIKFGLLLRKALAIGCDRLATGHYARIRQPQISNLPPRLRYGETGKSQTCNLKTEELKNLRTKEQSRFVYSRDSYISSSPNKLTPNSYNLFAGVDKTKDQSYMLYHLNQAQLSRVLFPLGEMTKKEVRELAMKWDLPVKEKPESQEICFFGDKDYRSFLKRYLPAKYFKSGQIVDKKGNVLGEHQGLINYTIGQRKGVTQELKNSSPDDSEMSGSRSKHRETKEQVDKEPLYVVGFDIKNNQLIVGSDKEVFLKEMIVTNINWIQNLKANKLIPNSLSVKIRYRHEAVACKLKNLRTEELKNPSTPLEASNLSVVFNKPQRAVTPGQSAVFYRGDQVLGGGIIK